MPKISLVLIGLCIALTQAQRPTPRSLKRDLKDLRRGQRGTSDAPQVLPCAGALETTSGARPIVCSGGDCVGASLHAAAYLALALLPHARRPQLVDEEARDRVPGVVEAGDPGSSGVLRARRFADPMVSLEIMGVDVEEPEIDDYTSAEAQVYFRYYAWAIDLALGRYQSAQERLTKLAQREFNETKHPEKVPDYILLYRGLAAAHSGQYGLAIPDFRVLLERRQKQQQSELIHIPLDDNDYRFMLAALYHLAGNKDSAIVLYQESLEHDLGLVTAHSFLASIYEQSGRDLTHWSSASGRRMNGDDPAALFELAVSLFNAGKVRECVEHSYHAVGRPTLRAAAHYLLGCAAGV